DHARRAARRIDPRPASQHGRAVRRQRCGRAAQHRATGGGGQRRGGGDRTARHVLAHHRGEDCAGFAGCRSGRSLSTHGHRQAAPRVRMSGRHGPLALSTGLLIRPAYEPARLADLAALAEDTGYDDFWLADERFFREVYACLTVCALRTHRIRLGPCVTDPYSRHPALTAMAMATLDGISNQRSVLGLGAGVSGVPGPGVDTSPSAVAIPETVDPLPPPPPQ